MYAFAMPRGSGKTALCRHAAWWAMSYAHSRYVFIIAANEKKAKTTLDSIKKFMRFLPDWSGDFPEISKAVDSLGGVANRASGQLCQGRSTMIEWGKDQIVLPTVPAPSNLEGCEEEFSPTSGIIAGVSGLTGDGIRGSVFTTTTGEQVRPDFVLLDDPQTAESAGSPSQNADRELLIHQDVLGMAGPGKGLSAIMPCTVIRRGDMVDNVLDRTKHPLWRGERTRMLVSMPKNMDEIERYRSVYEDCAQKEPPDFTEAIAYWSERRNLLEEGAEASWPERKDWEVSAIQHAIHLFFRSEEAFWAEYQNEPLDRHDLMTEFPDSDAVGQRGTGLKRGIVPPECNKITAFIDVQGRLLYYAVAAWSDGFGGQVIDYGAWPEQPKRYYILRDAHPTLSDSYPSDDINGSIYEGAINLVDRLCGRPWKTAGGESIRIERLMIDAGWGDSTKTIYKVCRNSQYASILSPSFGRGVTARQQPMSEWKQEPGEERGHDWLRRLTKGEGVRHVIYDTNTWKTLIQRRLGLPVGSRGAITLFTGNPSLHRMFADHATAEPPVPTSGRGRDLIEWLKPIRGRDNHLGDCLVGCAVAASILGVKASGHETTEIVRKRVKLSEIQKRKAG